MAVKKPPKGKKKQPKIEGETRSGGKTASLTYAKAASSSVPKTPSKAASGSAKQSSATTIHHDPSFDNHHSTRINSSTMTKATNRPQAPLATSIKSSSEKHRPANSRSSHAGTRHTQETSQRYNEMLCEGGIPGYYAAIEADLDALKKEVRILAEAAQDDVNNSPVSDDYISVEYSSGSDDIGRPDPAAARLQRVHDRNSQISTQTASSDAGESVDLQPESFPVLGTPSSSLEPASRPGSVTSYARVVQSSTPSRSLKELGQESPRRIHHVQKSDRDWVVVDRSRRTKGSVHFSPSDSSVSGVGQSSTPRYRQSLDDFVRSGVSNSNLRSSMSPRNAKTSDNPALATEKRALERRLRKSLPENWLQASQDITPSPHSSPRSPAVDTLRNIARSSTARSPARTNHVSARDCFETVKNTPHASHSLKSKPSKSTLSKVTASGTPSYATPTAASKHRSTGTPDSEISVASRKNKNARLESDQHELVSGNGRVPPDEKSMLEKHTKADKSSCMWNGMQGFTRRIADNNLSSFGMDGSNDYREASVLQTSHGNTKQRSTRRNKIGLKIAIPDKSALPHLVRAISPSRIPVSVYHSGSDNSAIPVPTQASAAKPRRNTVERLVKRDEQTSENDDGQKRLRRASILEPIRRRLSAASSRSRSGSTVATTESEQHQATAGTDEVEQVVDDAFIDQSTQTDTTITAIDTRPGVVQSNVADASPQKLSLPTADSSEPTSARLLSTIQQTAKDHTEYLTEEAKETKVPIALHSVPEESRLSISHETLTSSSPEQDPAVLECGPVKISMETNDPHTSKTFTASLENTLKATSLRATAPNFVPTPVQSLFVPPKHLPPPEIPSAETLPSQASPPQYVNTLDYVSDWMPKEEWQTLTPAQKMEIMYQRRPQGASPVSSNGLSSAGLSSSMTLSSSFTPQPSSGSPERRRAHWNWFNSGQNGSGSPVRFGRAPLPTMSEEDDHSSSPRKGWDIGSAAPGWWYGWKGGDGLEISFSGYGPDAEKNSSAPVNFRDYEKASYQRGFALPNQTPGQHAEANTPSAPKRMREWASRKGYPAVPCSNFEVTDAFEHVGVAGTQSYVDGWCHTCWPAH